MRTLGLLACLLLLSSEPAAAIDKFPYTAYVNADDVYVRSGPGQNYYPTSKLDLGAEVEVYRHDPGGWYAVRPPQGSFCWVAARYLKIDRDGLAVVTGDRVVARVGSDFSDIRDVIQVRLDRGEEVEVLETKNLDPGDGAEKWAKVAPVAGEFRWILGKFVDRTPPEPTLLAENPRRNLLLSRAEAMRTRASDEPYEVTEKDSVAASAATRVSHEAALEPAEPSRQGFRPVRRSSTRDSVAENDRFDNREPAGRLASFEQGQDPRQTDSILPPDVAPPRPYSDNTVNAEEFQAELDAVDLEISQMVAEEPTAWTFAELRTRAETALARAQTAIERGRARLVLNKINRFEEIRLRYETVTEVQSETDLLNAQIANAPSMAEQAPPPSDSGPRFDGTGRLAAILAPRVGQPQFALLDETGQVRTYITAAPGLTLRPYVGRYVGIDGTRGFMPELKAQHLTAKRLTLLNGPIVR